MTVGVQIKQDRGLIEVTDIVLTDDVAGTVHLRPYGGLGINVGEILKLARMSNVEVIPPPDRIDR